MNHTLGNPQFWYVALAAYWTVFVAELVGDKSLYTAASLVLRFRPGIVFGVSAVAFATKMAVAVFLGGVIMIQRQARWIDILSAVGFFISAMLVWFDEPAEPLGELRVATSWLRTVWICLSAFLLTEWGDPGQIVAAALAVKSRSMFGPWVGGTLAMMTKCGLAMAIGLKLRNRLPKRMLRGLASISCSLLGLLALAGAFFH